jgi:hypothetical protein
LSLTPDTRHLGVLFPFARRSRNPATIAFHLIVSISPGVYAWVQRRSIGNNQMDYDPRVVAVVDDEVRFGFVDLIVGCAVVPLA